MASSSRSDGGTADTCTISRPHDIYSMASVCKNLFFRYLGSRISPACVTQVTTCQRQFLTWANFLDVFANESDCLDRRLEFKPELNELVISMLRVLERNLDQALVRHIDHRMNEEEVKSDGTMYGIIGAVDRLQRLAVTIRQPYKSSEAEKVYDFASKQIPDGLPSALCTVMQSLFPGAERSLLVQIVESIVYRRYRMLWSLRDLNSSWRRKPEEGTQELHEGDAGLKSEQCTGLELFLHSGQPPLPPGVATERLYPATMSFIRPMGSLARNLRQLWQEGQIDDVRRVQYPSPQGSEGKVSCQYCFNDLDIAPNALPKVQWNLWRHHVMEDMRPFVCVSEECRRVPTSFSSEMEWRAHMNERHGEEWIRYIHRVKWSCRFCGDDAGHFSSEEEMLVHHLTQENVKHPPALDAFELAKIKLNSRDSKPRPANDCPLCGPPPWVNPQIFIEREIYGRPKPDSLSAHFAAHLEGLALLSISRWYENVEAIRTGNNGTKKEDTDRVLEQLEADIRILQEDVDHTTKDGPNIATRLYRLGTLVGQKYLRTGNMADLDMAITLGRDAINATPIEHPDRAVFCNSLGIRLTHRYLRTLRILDLERAIRVARESVAATTKGHLDQGAYLDTLAISLGQKYLQSGRICDLDEAIRFGRESVGAMPRCYPDWVACSDGLGILLSYRFSQTENIDDLEEAICIGRKVTDATPHNHPDQAVFLDNLAISLSQKYYQTRQIADLEEAILIGRKAIAATPHDHQDRTARLYSLGNRLGNKFIETGDMADLEEAICIGRKAVDTTPHDHPDRATRLDSLGSRLRNKFSVTEDMSDLEEAIRIGREAVYATPHYHPDRATRLDSLGSRLRNKFSVTEDMADLEEAIRIGREAVDVTPHDHQERSTRLASLGSRLSHKFLQTRTSVDLEEAIRIGREVTAATPQDHPDRPARLYKLATLLSQEYFQTRNRTDLEGAIRIGREAVDATPDDHPDRATRLDSLGSRLCNKFSVTEDMGDLEEAIRIGQEAVYATPHDHPDRATRLESLGSRLRGKYSLTEDVADFEEYIRIEREAFDATPRGHDGSLNDEDFQVLVV